MNEREEFERWWGNSDIEPAKSHAWAAWQASRASLSTEPPAPQEKISTVETSEPSMAQGCDSSAGAAMLPCEKCKGLGVVPIGDGYSVDPCPKCAAPLPDDVARMVEELRGFQDALGWANDFPDMPQYPGQAAAMLEQQARRIAQLEDWNKYLASHNETLATRVDQLKVAPRVPEGYALVPLEPTDAMIEASCAIRLGRIMRAVREQDDPIREHYSDPGKAVAEEYRAMLAAAPHNDEGRE